MSPETACQPCYGSGKRVIRTLRRLFIGDAFARTGRVTFVHARCQGCMGAGHREPGRSDVLTMEAWCAAVGLELPDPVYRLEGTRVVGEPRPDPRAGEL